MSSAFKAIWNRLVGPREAPSADEPVGEAVDYKGYRIRPAPYKAGSGYQTAGVIEKNFPDGVKEHRFIRSETHPSRDAAAAFAIVKGRQIIDQQGDRMFSG